MNNFCLDCGVEEGRLHLEVCDNELCSKCGRQVLLWGKCKGAKPEPFFETFGYACERCGKLNFGLPENVSNEEWDFICGSTYGKKCVLCKPCMDFIKKKREGKNGN